MDWQQAVAESEYKQAWRIDVDGRQVIRYADGHAIRSCLNRPDHREDCPSEALEGFRDWTPLGQVRR